jgi:hypothetical protein
MIKWLWGWIWHSRFRVHWAVGHVLGLPVMFVRVRFWRPGIDPEPEDPDWYGGD